MGRNEMTLFQLAMQWFFSILLLIQPSAMKKLLTLLLLAGIWSSCHKHIEPGCTVSATVIDFSSSAGCGFGFQTPNGTILIAEQHTNTCGHHNDPLLNFQLYDGMKVKIGYEIENEHTTKCTAGAVVQITCIQVDQIKD